MKPLNHTITSDSRIAIEGVLKAARRPLSAQEVADLAGVSIAIARTHLGNATQKGRAHNLNPHARTQARYVWGKAPIEYSAPQPRSHYASAPLAPQKWNIREGGDAHEKCLSRRGDTFVEHRPPLTLGAAS